MQSFSAVYKRLMLLEPEKSDCLHYCRMDIILFRFESIFLFVLRFSIL
uniref:Uncharacterized protein n=1 Tax=Anguilla anguilla TaxID=7936 RepID=A0A0E9SEE8_ANGAN